MFAIKQNIYFLNLKITAMKNFREIILILCLINFVSISHAQEEVERKEKRVTTTIQFLNGNTYVKPNNGHWLKISDGGFEVMQRPLKKNKKINHKSGTEGDWVISDNNVNYQFNHSRFPKKMANYKDSSVIVAGFLRSTDSTVAKIFINRTVDRGDSWHSIYEETTALAQLEFYQVQHPSPSHIIAIAEKWVQDSMGNPKKTFFLMTSSDTASNWSVNDSIFGIDDVPLSFNFKGKYGMINLLAPDTSILLYSEDYGTSWQQYVLPADLIYGYGRILGKDSIVLTDHLTNKKMGYTNDIKSGTWQYANLPDTFSSNSTYIRNVDTVWSARPVNSGIGNLQRSFITGTTDGGQNWNTALNVLEDTVWARLGLNKIDFATKNYGAALGSNILYLTEDGGQTWENMGFLDKPLTPSPQVMFYYYNPDTKKRLLMTLLNQQYIMKYEFIDSITSLPKRENIESLLKLHPNPAKNNLFLQLPKELVIKNGIINILTIQGKEVGSFNLNNNNQGYHEISINNLPQGVFILQLISNNYVGSKLFIKQ